MGAIFTVSTTIKGGVTNPSPAFADSPTSGIYDTGQGLGIALAGKSYAEFEPGSFTCGFRPALTASFTLTAITGSPFTTGIEPGSVALSTDGTNVYVSNASGNTITAFSRNAITGLLTAIVGSPFAASGTPSGVSVSPDGAHAYVCSVTGDVVHAYTRNTITGALAAVGSYGAGIRPRSTIISPDGAHVYAVNETSNTVSQFTRNASTGVLSALGGSPSTGSSPKFGTISPDGNHVYVTNGSGSSLSAFSRSATSGVLTAVAGSPFATAAGPRFVSVSPDGAHVYVAHGSSVSAFSRNASTGVLTAVAGSPFATAAGAFGVSVAPNGAHVYVASSSSMNVFSRNVTTGELTDIAGSPFPGLNVGQGMAVSPDGAHVFGTNSNTATLTVYSTLPPSANPTYSLLHLIYDSSGGLGGAFNVNGSLFQNGERVPSVSTSDGRYAKLAGLVTQAFSALRFRASEAANGAQGIATLVAGTVTVANTSVTANSRIVISAQEGGALTGFLRVSARVAGTSFTISSSVGTDTANVAYHIFEAA